MLSLNFHRQGRAHASRRHEAFFSIGAANSDRKSPRAFQDGSDKPFDHFIIDPIPDFTARDCVFRQPVGPALQRVSSALRS
jgi:hypothetical protein